MNVIWHLCTLFILTAIHKKSAQVNGGTNERKLGLLSIISNWLVESVLKSRFMFHACRFYVIFSSPSETSHKTSVSLGNGASSDSLKVTILVNGVAN